MLDIGWTEMLALAVIMIVVVGPKDLPGVLRGLGRMTRKLRGMADEFRRGVDEFMRESELKELSDGVEKVRNFNLDKLKADTAKSILPENPLNDKIDVDSPKPKQGSATGQETQATQSSQATEAAPSAESSEPAAPTPPEPAKQPEKTAVKKET